MHAYFVTHNTLHNNILPVYLTPPLAVEHLYMEFKSLDSEIYQIPALPSTESVLSIFVT